MDFIQLAYTVAASLKSLTDKTTFANGIFEPHFALMICLGLQNERKKTTTMNTMQSNGTPSTAKQNKSQQYRFIMMIALEKRVSCFRCYKSKNDLPRMEKKCGAREIKCHTHWFSTNDAVWTNKIEKEKNKTISMGRLNINQHLTASSNTDWQQIIRTISALPNANMIIQTAECNWHFSRLVRCITNQPSPKSTAFPFQRIDIISFYKSVWQPNKTFHHDGNGMIYVQRLDRQ